MKIITMLKQILFGVRVTFRSAPVTAVLTVMCYFIQSAIPIAEAYAMKNGIDGIMTIRDDGGQARLVLWLSVFIVIFIVSKAFAPVSLNVYASLSQRVTHYIDKLMIEKISKSDFSFFDNAGQQDILRVVSENKNVIQNIAWQGIYIISNIMSIITAMTVMLTLSRPLALMTLLFVLPAVIVNRRYQQFLWKYDYINSKTHRRMDYCYDVLKRYDCAEEIRINNSGDCFKRMYFELWDSWYKKKNERSIKQNIYMLLANLLQTAGVGVVLISSILKYTRGVISIGSIQYYVSLSEQIKANLTSLFDTVTELDIDSEKVAVIRNFLSWTPNVLPSGDKIPDAYPRIEFKNVSFKYPFSDRYILSSCSFVIDGREKLAIVGRNGAGKSTIIKLLLRLYDPTEGIILVNGIDAGEYDIKAYRRLFSAQLQDFATYSMSVAENVRVGDIGKKEPEASVAVTRSLEFSGIDGYVSGLPKGVDTNITKLFDENGVEPSGGQKQKLALARAHYRDADILILDEPSAALDPEAEYEIFSKLIELWKQRGAVLISHRLSNVTRCDRIIVLDSGGVTESGTHKELMLRGGEYASLFKLQAEKYYSN